MNSTRNHLDCYREQGFVVLPDVLDVSELEAVRAALQPYLDLEVPGRNDFEGERTRRVYSLVGRGVPRSNATVEHPAGARPVGFAASDRLTC